jgi:cutinase
LTAIAVFGNPSAKLGLPLTVSAVWGGRAIDLCNPGDPICETGGESVATHRAYAARPDHQAADFVAGLL